MKVPKMYKSSDRYNGGTDVVYNDESELQYAPFIYATTQSGNSSDEGEDMILHINISSETGGLDKTWQEIADAIEAGKFCYVTDTTEAGSITFVVTGAFENNGSYFVNILSATPLGEVTVFRHHASSASDYPVYDSGD